MRIDYVKINDDKSFTFAFIDSNTGERKGITLTDDEVALLNYFHRKMHTINGSIQDFELGGPD